MGAEMNSHQRFNQFMDRRRELQAQLNRDLAMAKVHGIATFLGILAVGVILTKIFCHH